MAKKVIISDLAAEIERELTDYHRDITAGMKKETQKIAREARTELKQTSPRRIKGVKHYADMWKVKRVSEWSNAIEMRVQNDRYYLTHLLENGHAKVNGGRVKAYPHIGPAQQHVNEKLAGRIKVMISDTD